MGWALPSPTRLQKFSPEVWSKGPKTAKSHSEVRGAPGVTDRASISKPICPVVPARNTYQPVLFSILAELTLPFSRQPVRVITSGSKSSILPPPSVVPTIGVSAQTGMAVLQSGEFWAKTAVEHRMTQQRTLERSLIEVCGLWFILSMPYITLVRSLLVYTWHKKGGCPSMHGKAGLSSK